MRGLAVTIAAALLAAHAQASFVQFSSSTSATGRGSYRGTMEWTHEEGAGSGSLVVSLTNTSALDNGGFLTAFGFNTVDGVSVTFSGVIGNGAARRWRAFSDFAVRGYGVIDTGAAIGSRWWKGGKVIYGISVGRTKAFAFDVLGDEGLLSELTAHSFIDDSSGVGVIARFRNFDDAGTDIATATLPAPGAVTLLGLGAGLLRRRAR